MQIFLILFISIHLIDSDLNIMNQKNNESKTQMVIDFKNQEKAKNWFIVNDGVMGGLSKSEIKMTDDSTGVFQGKVSLENNGGFASTRYQGNVFNLATFDGLIIRIKGDGKKYQLRLRDSGRFDGISYRYIFDTRENEWLEIEAPFSEFVPVFRGRIISDAPKISTDNIRQIGFLISDEQEGNFRLEMEWIKAFKRTE